MSATLRAEALPTRLRHTRLRFHPRVGLHPLASSVGLTRWFHRWRSQVPTEYTDPATGEKKRVGGPHCMRECPLTGDIWTGLKGALKDSPCGTGSAKQKSACCDDAAQRQYMEELKAKGFDTEEPNGWAVWQVRAPTLAVLWRVVDTRAGHADGVASIAEGEHTEARRPRRKSRSWSPTQRHCIASLAPERARLVAATLGAAARDVGTARWHACVVSAV